MTLILILAPDITIDIIDTSLVSMFSNFIYLTTLNSYKKFIMTWTLNAYLECNALIIHDIQICLNISYI